MTKILFATLAALFATSAHAQQTYLGATIAPGGSWEYRSSPNSPSVDEKALFGKLYGGYAFDETWALEGGFGAFEKAQFDKTKTGMPYDASFKAGMFYLAARASHRFNDRWSVTGKLGAARHSQELDRGAGTGTIDDHVVRPMFGLGVSYDLTPGAALTLDLVNYGTVHTGETDRKSRMLEMGVKFSF